MKTPGHARRPTTRALALALVVLAAWASQARAQAQAQARDEPMPGDYRVEGGRVDRGTYSGWRLYHTACYGCHGVGGGGTDIAPNLVERIQTLAPRGFATRVLTSYRITPYTPDGSAEERQAEREAQLEEVLRRERSSRGQALMPAWDADDKVAPHVLDLYAYLTARAYAGLGPGKPRLLATKKR
jgi:cytochrome c5